MAFLGEEKYTGMDDSDGKKQYYQVLPDADKAGMYYGRKVIYVIPELTNGYYDIILKMLVNNYTTSKYEGGAYTPLITGQDHATTGHHAHIKIAQTALNVSNSLDSKPVFTPWIRAMLHVKSKTDVENIVKFTKP